MALVWPAVTIAALLMEEYVTDTEKLEAVENQLQILGDAIADVFEQLVKGNWMDDIGHHVSNNAAMIGLADAMESTIKMRNEVLGYIGGGQFL